MNTTPAMVHGMVKPDGTLEIQGTVNLPAGPVQIQVQPILSPPNEDWWQYLQRCRTELEASGASFRRGVDIAAEMDEIRGEHDRVDALYWEQEWDKHHPGDKAC